METSHQKDVASSSEANFVPADATNQLTICYSCSLEVADNSPYRCRNCTYEEPNDSEIMRFFCEHCIAIHIRKQHEVIDCNGYEPAVCKDHKQISSWFCEDCKCTFCANCINKHAKHDFLEVDKKAAVLKKELFSVVGDLDANLKSLNAKTDEMKEIISGYSEQLKVEQEWVNSLVRKLEIELKQKISEKRCEDPDGNLVSLKARSDQGTDAQNSLIFLLQMSNGKLVESFEDRKAKAFAALEDQNQFLVKEKSLENFSFQGDLNVFVANMVETILEKVSIANITELNDGNLEKIETKIFLPDKLANDRSNDTLWIGSHKTGGSLLDIIQASRGVVMIRSWKLEKAEGKLKLIMDSYWESDLQNCPMVIFPMSDCDFAYLQDRKWFNLKTDMVAGSQIITPVFGSKFQNGDILIVEDNSKTQHALYWSKETRNIKFDPVINIDAKCLTQCPKPRPFLKHTMFNANTCLKVEVMDLIYINFIEKRVSYIYQKVHEFPEIDYIHPVFEEQSHFVVWCSQLKCGKVLKLCENKKIEVVEVFSWSEEASHISIRLNSVNKTCTFCQFSCTRKLYSETSNVFEFNDQFVIMLISMI